MVDSCVLVERENGVVTLTMNDPDTLNAWSAEMGHALMAELERAERSPSDRVIVLTGAGQRGFNSGLNMKRLTREGSLSRTQSTAAVRTAEDHFEKFESELTQLQQLTWKFRSIPKPTIAAVNGAAAGGGLGLAAACDMRIASTNARFVSSFVRRGIVPDEGSLYFLPQVIGLSRTFELAFTGRLIGAVEAERIGLVSKVVAPDELMPEVRSLALELATFAPPITVGLIKRVLTKSVGLGFQETMALADRALRISIETEDHHEAVRAYGEKRTPVFKGL